MNGDAVFQQVNLPSRLVLDGLLDVAIGVDILDLAPRSQILAGAAHRDVHIGAEVALLHVAVAGAEIAQDGADLLHIGGSLLGRVHVRPRDDLHQRGAGPVEVHVGTIRVQVVDRLSRILLQVQPFDAHDEAGPVVPLDLDLAFSDDRVLVLADLIAGGQVRIEVILAVETAPFVNLGLEAQAGPHGLLDAVPVDHRQHARHGRVDQADLFVGACAKAHRCAGKQLGPGRHLGVDLQSDDDLPGAGPAVDELGFCCAHGASIHRRSSRPKAVAHPLNRKRTSLMVSS